MKTKKPDSRKPSGPPEPTTRANTAWFFGIMLSIPVLFFLVLEAGLRLGGYRGNLDLFIPVDWQGKAFYQINPDFSKRYFFTLSSPPSPSSDLFLQQKPENGLRIFYLGESSAAGYPYGHNGMASRVLADVLSDRFPDKHVEVVNLGMSAINSYTLYDMTAEILEQQPDAIMIYTGHNEYYGALGVGSNESLGSLPGFVRFYLKIQRLKTFLLLRDGIVKLALLTSNKDIDQSKTLMERVVREQVIPKESTSYQLGLLQFESNMKALLDAYAENDVPVYLATVASNLKDFAPFYRTENDSTSQAVRAYQTAKAHLAAKDTSEANRYFVLAKELDAIRFRAPEAINDAIKALAQQEHVYLVDTEAAIRNHSAFGIPGNEWFLEHLHPTWQGNHLIARTFAEAFFADGPFKNPAVRFSESDWAFYKDRMLLSEFDERMCWHILQVLYSGWPFRDRSLDRSLYLKNYKIQSPADSMAIKQVHDRRIWANSKYELALLYIKLNQFQQAGLEFEGLFRDDPSNPEHLLEAAKCYLNSGDAAKAYRNLKKRAAFRPKEFFTIKMLGITALSLGRTDEAIGFMEQAQTLDGRVDPQLLYNLSGAYGMKQNFEKAAEFLERTAQADPNFPGIDSWRAELKKHLKR